MTPCLPTVLCASRKKVSGGRAGDKARRHPLISPPGRQVRRRRGRADHPTRPFFQALDRRERGLRAVFQNFPGFELSVRTDHPEAQRFLFEELDQMRARHVEQVGGLLRCQLRVYGHDGHGVPVSHLNQHVHDQPSAPCHAGVRLAPTRAQRLRRVTPKTL